MNKLLLAGFLLINFLINNNLHSQVNENDIASWGLGILGKQLNKNKYYDFGDAAIGLSKVFKESSERQYEKELASVINSVNIPNGYYYISNGKFYNIPDGYLKQSGQWYSINQYTNDRSAIVINGRLYDLNANNIIYYSNNTWMTLDKSYMNENQGLLLDHGDLKILNEGWFQKDGKWNHINTVVNSSSKKNKYKFETRVPFGLYIYSGWYDRNQDGLPNMNELVGLNKEIFNIAKEKLYVGINIPNIEDKIVFTSWKGKKLIGSTVEEVKDWSPGRSMFIGPGGNPGQNMDFVDRIEFDVRKNRGGQYRICVFTTNKELTVFERTATIFYKK